MADPSTWTGSGTSPTSRGDCFRSESRWVVTPSVVHDPDGPFVLGVEQVGHSLAGTAFPTVGRCDFSFDS